MFISFKLSVMKISRPSFCATVYLLIFLQDQELALLKAAVFASMKEVSKTCTFISVRMIMQFKFFYFCRFVNSLSKIVVVEKQRWT